MKNILVVTAYIDFFNHKDIRETHRHVRIMVNKTLKDAYGHILNKDKRTRISNILANKYSYRIYWYGKYYEEEDTGKPVNHVGLLISLDLINCKYKVIKFTGESITYKKDKSIRPILRNKFK